MVTLSRPTLLAAALIGPAAAPALAWADAPGEALARAAKAQLGVTTRYDANYRRIAYPGGDAPRAVGVCADVVVRAARDAWGADLQRLVHEDMAAAFADYPSHRVWGLGRPDANIDHRRVLNLEAYWRRCGARTWPSVRHAAGFVFEGPLEAGDLLTWRLNGRLPHVGVVESGGLAPSVIHNIGAGVERWPLAFFTPHVAIAHYRWRPTARAPREL
jgi:uncharacterized protein YijF (DUF1287 family)